jgi:cytochrome c553
MRYVAVIAVSIALVVTFACKRGEDTYIQEKVDLSGASPQQAYVALNCAKCHGTDLKGQRTAPALTGLAAHWTEDQLIAYLRDPPAVRAANPRMAYVAEQFAIEMPAYPHTDEAALRGLVGWIITQ